MRIQVDNTYSDGHESRLFYDIDDREVPEEPEEMWDHLWNYTGDGHGIGRDQNGAELGYCHEIKILDAVNPYVIGLTREWSGA